MVGVVLIVLALVVVGPIAIMLGGAIWSALFAWLVIDDTDHSAEGQPA
jgi:hypothetical protein